MLLCLLSTKKIVIMSNDLVHLRWLKAAERKFKSAIFYFTFGTLHGFPKE